MDESLPPSPISLFQKSEKFTTLTNIWWFYPSPIFLINGGQCPDYIIYGESIRGEGIVIF
jgi:hypothetical protein